MKHLSISFLALACICSPAWGQQAPSVKPAFDQANYQSNVPVLAPPTTAQPPSVVPLEESVAAPEAAAAAPSAGTAREQGYTGNLNAPTPWDAETFRQRESARQRGETVGVASRKNGVALDSAHRSWFMAWETRLVSIGVHPDKVKFEGRRLTKDQFSMWASRQVWAIEAGLIAP